MAVVVALAALMYTAKAANAASQQTRLQKQLAVDAGQPYVWADIRPDSHQGGLLTLVLGNSGPTIATDVKVSFDPPLDMPFREESQHAVEVLERGLPSLPPGRNWVWNMGVAWQVVASDGPKNYELTVEANGPFGAIKPLNYIVSIDDIRRTRSLPDGSLHLVAEAVTKTNQTLQSIADTIAAAQRTQENEEAP